MYSQKNYAEILSFSSSHGLRLQEISKSSQNIMTGREKCLCCDGIQFLLTNYYVLCDINSNH